VPTTPAQVFHMIRRQAIRPLRKPLIVLTPKSLLRHKEAISTLEDLAEGHFHNVLDETEALDREAVQRIILCSGKVYYDLLAARRERGISNIAILRIEQLYPFPEAELLQALSTYPNIVDAVWCQEEPMNQGAWYQIRHHLEACISNQHSLRYAGREASAAPAVGSHDTHVAQQRLLVEQALLNRKSPASHLKSVT
jgi:2-oxoglutarate dehydrogenase E1 component